MKSAGLSLFLLICLNHLQAQTGLRTLVTGSPVVVGESFQVQYVLEGTEKGDEVIPPDFKNFRRISGPDIYTAAAYGATGPITMKNTVYTLAALKPGIYKLPAAIARISGKLVKGDEATITVISKDEAIARRMLPQEAAQHTEYYLRPGEDPMQKIRNNLFLRVSVDKRKCYVGQPVTATFKLYSRLESKSDIIKNPGFYGFTVQDMIGLKDKLSATEMVNGKRFDVHTVRKVQLYPLQAGTFTIDPMEVMNRVEFSTRMVNKKAEQEISEGVYTQEDPVAYNHSEVFENTMSTEPVTVNVQALPTKNQPATFNGAIGRFTISAALAGSEWVENKEGRLEITVSGKGNFTQLSAPQVQWPKGIEGFEPEIKDTFDISTSPLQGQRKFIFRFVASRAGDYTIPSIVLPFFDPDSNRYISRSTQPVKLPVAATGKRERGEKKSLVKQVTGSHYKWITGIVTGLLIAGSVLFFLSRKKKQLARAEKNRESQRLALPALQAILAPVHHQLQAADKEFYLALRSAIWQYLGTRLHLSGSRMSKQELAGNLNGKGVDDQAQQQVFQLLEVCETGIFTGAQNGLAKEDVLYTAQAVLQQVEQKLG